MFSPDDNSGTFTVLIGLIILIFSAVGLSLLADKRFQFSSSQKNLLAAVAAGEAELTSLRERERGASSRLSLTIPSRSESNRLLEESERAIEANKRDIADLSARRAALETEIAGIEELFAKTRAEIRAGIWRTAVGEELGSIRTKDGRSFENAVITRVTPAGLVIRHDHGNARLNPADLDPSYQERFQWDRTERLAVLKEEHRVRTSLTETPPEPERKPARRARDRAARFPAPEPENIPALQANLRIWRTKVAQLTAERNEAALRKNEGARSVPGSLETWSSRHDRVTRQLDRARDKLRVARDNLAEADPRDPLLRVLDEEE